MKTKKIKADPIPATHRCSMSGCSSQVPVAEVYCEPCRIKIRRYIDRTEDFLNQTARDRARKKALVAVAAALLSSTAAFAGGMRGPDGTLYCDSGFTAENDKCVAVKRADPPPRSSQPAIEYGPESPNQGRNPGGYHSYSGSYSGSEEERLDHSRRVGVVVQERVTVDHTK